MIGSEVTAQQSGIVPFRPARTSAPEAHRTLQAAGVSSTLHGDRIRLSVHATTTPESVAMAVAALGHQAGQAGSPATGR